MARFHGELAGILGAIAFVEPELTGRGARLERTGPVNRNDAPMGAAGKPCSTAAIRLPAANSASRSWRSAGGRFS